MDEGKMPMVVRNERKAISDSQIEVMLTALNAIQAATSARACKEELEPISRIVAELASAECLARDDDDATDSIQALPESIAKAKQLCENDFVDEFKDVSRAFVISKAGQLKGESNFSVWWSKAKSVLKTFGRHFYWPVLCQDFEGVEFVWRDALEPKNAAAIVECVRPEMERVALQWHTQTQKFNSKSMYAMIKCQLSDELIRSICPINGVEHPAVLVARVLERLTAQGPKSHIQSIKKEIGLNDMAHIREFGGGMSGFCTEVNSLYSELTAQTPQRVQVRGLVSFSPHSDNSGT